MEWDEMFSFSHRISLTTSLYRSLPQFHTLSPFVSIFIPSLLFHLNRCVPANSIHIKNTLFSRCYNILSPNWHTRGEREEQENVLCVCVFFFGFIQPADWCPVSFECLPELCLNKLCSIFFFYDFTDIDGYPLSHYNEYPSDLLQHPFGGARVFNKFHYGFAIFFLSRCRSLDWLYGNTHTHTRNIRCKLHERPTHLTVYNK